MLLKLEKFLTLQADSTCKSDWLPSTIQQFCYLKWNWNAVYARNEASEYSWTIRVAITAHDWKSSSCCVSVSTEASDDDDNNNDDSNQVRVREQ